MLREDDKEIVPSSGPQGHRVLHLPAASRSRSRGAATPTTRRFARGPGDRRRADRVLPDADRGGRRGRDPHRLHPVRVDADPGADVIRLLPLEVVEGEEAPAAGRRAAAVRVRAGRRGVLDALLPQVHRQPDLLLPAAGGGLRAGQPAAGDEVGDRQRAGSDREPDPRGQPGPAGRDHPGNQRDRRRRRTRWPTPTPGASERDDCHGYREDNAAGATPASAASPGSSARSSTSSSPPTRCRRCTTRSRWTSPWARSTQTITLEVALHVGDNIVRAISLKPTDGLVRGAEVRDTGAPISVPGRRRHQGPRLVTSPASA